MIHLTYFCEELFLVKHETKHSCESAIFYKLGSDVIKENCNFKYSYNATVIPSVLDGGSQIVLANMINKKKLSCSTGQFFANVELRVISLTFCSPLAPAVSLLDL